MLAEELKVWEWKEARGFSWLLLVLERVGRETDCELG